MKDITKKAHSEPEVLNLDSEDYRDATEYMNDASEEELSAELGFCPRYQMAA